MIVNTKFETEMYDVMGGNSRQTIKVHEHGLVALCDVMPRFAPVGHTADYAIVQAARVSYGVGTKQLSDDRGLIRYLKRHKHTSTFEMAEVKLHFVMPIFIARQHVRHRMSSTNEYSARYSVVKERFYVPEISAVRSQSKTNKQGGTEPIGEVYAKGFADQLEIVSAECYEDYTDAINMGVSRELARCFLPVNAYTEFYWKVDLHNLMGYLTLRMDSHAQQEIRDYANAMYQLVQPIFPLSIEAFDDYQRNSMNLSRLEIEAIKNGSELDSTNSREKEEWEAKKILLNL